MPKWVVFLTICLAGGTSVLLMTGHLSQARINGPFYIAYDLVFWGTVSAAATVATGPGRWREKFKQSASQTSRKAPRWIWPLLIILLAVANYLVAIVVVAANWAFSTSTNENPRL